MTDAEKALADAVKEAHERVCELVSDEFRYGQPRHDEHPASDACGWRHSAIDRALDLARKVGALSQAERDWHETNKVGCEQGCKCCVAQYDWFKREDVRLRKSIEEATK